MIICLIFKKEKRDFSVKNTYMQDFIVEKMIFHTQDLCLCTLDTNLICKKCVEVRINMTHKRNKFLTFCFSCMPGAGQMFLGFFKQGVSLMTVFFGIFIVSHWLYLSVLSLGAIIVWFYAFFDAMNKNSMPDEEFVMLEDAYIWGDNLDCLSKLPKPAGLIVRGQRVDAECLIVGMFCGILRGSVIV